ncbi:MAG: signal recognition particle-docking protein FtsY [Candidatus Dependentiae bacterium]|nr:signal recognition particle-docking protein FtsY [Candidatus Dependentiae bacterium]
MFSFFKNTFKKIFQQVTSKLTALFGRTHIDEDSLKELEILLLSADTGVKTTRSIIASLKEQCQRGNLQKGADLKIALKKALHTILTSVPKPTLDSRIHLLVGINGSGKTTFAGKLAHYYKQHNKKVLLIAADTFRAAAPEQLTQWAQRTGVDIVLGKPNQDPASVVFTGCEQFKKEQFDILIIDTAGRLQTKANLMNELAKIKRTIDKQLPGEPINVLLTIDSMLGQNSFEQAKIFKESTHVNGIVLTKMDGTGKGGIVFGIAQELTIPVAYVAFGEQANQFAPFDPESYLEELLNS